MNRDETVALFLQGEEAWNAWANKMLAEREKLKSEGRWGAEHGDWTSKVRADFTRCLFLVRGGEGTKDAAGDADKHEPEEDPPVKSISLDGRIIELGNFIFPGSADFQSATFKGAANIYATFEGYANFQSATFEGYANFVSASFKDNADFQFVTFEGEANFQSASFHGYYGSFWGATFRAPAAFLGAAFQGNACFQFAIFERFATFDSATFQGFAWFHRATFQGYADFRFVTFKRSAYFDSATFKGNAIFQSTTFQGNANFQSAAIGGRALFGGQTFANDVSFNSAKFGPLSRADFSLATFEQALQFDHAVFEGEADFNAVWGKRTFSMARAHFKGVPDFIQAHFEETPRLDNVVVEGRLLQAREEQPKEGEKLPRRKQLHRWLKARSAPYRSAHFIYRRVTGGIAPGSALRNMPARWRALKRLAIKGHDSDREWRFFCGEIRSRRFTEHWPLPWPLWKTDVWAGFLGFWVGLLYQIYSNFGRSLVRPFAAWLGCIVIFAVYFLGQSPTMIAKRKELHRGGVYGQAIAYSTVALEAVKQRPLPECLSEEAEKDALKKRLVVDDKGNGFSGLVEQVRSQTNLVNEALSIAYHNAVIILDSSEGSAHRAFGCLYGLERYGFTPVASVPRNVAIASGIQKLLSAIFIFLFCLAVRNMLKMK
jgi:hypothetical protein